MGRVLRDGVGERIAIHVRSNQGDGLGRVFKQGDRLRLGQRRVIDRVDGDRDRRQPRVLATVVHAILERIRAVEVRVGRVGDLVGAGERRGAILGGHADRVDHLALVVVDVARGEGDDERRVLVGGDGLRIADRRVVDRIHRDRDERDVRCQRWCAVIPRGEGEGVVAVIVRVGPVGDDAIAAERDRAMGRLGDREGQAVADILIGSRELIRLAAIFLDGEAAAGRDWRVIDRRAIDRDRRGRGGQSAIRDGIGKGDGSFPHRWREHHARTARVRADDRAATRRLGDDVAQRRLRRFHVRTSQRDRHGLEFLCRGVEVLRHGAIVDRAHGEIDGPRGRQAAVAGDEGHARRAEPIGRRGEPVDVGHRLRHHARRAVRGGRWRAADQGDRADGRGRRREGDAQVARVVQIGRGHGEGHRCVLGGRDRRGRRAGGVSRSDGRRVIDAADVDRDRGRGRGAICDSVGKGVRSAEIGSGSVGHGLAGIGAVIASAALGNRPALG